MQRLEFNIPDKAQFRPDEVVRLTHLDNRVLAYWAREFEGVGPRGGETGEPRFSRQAVERILIIKKLLVEERLDKETVRQRLRQTAPVQDDAATETPRNKAVVPDGTLKQIKQGLKEILTILDRGAKI